MNRFLTTLALCLALAGCEEDRQNEVTPIQLGDRSRAPVAEEPSPYVVSPHVRRRERTEEERRAEALADSAGGGGIGGGGGGGTRPGDWDDQPPPPPSAREVERFRQELEREAEARVDPDEDPCAQFADQAAAAAEAASRSGERTETAELRALRRRCRAFPEGYRNCIDQDYFRDHMDECQEQLQAMARHGERITERARRQQREGALDPRRAVRDDEE